MAHGYIKLHRQLQNNWLWQERRSFSKAEAWIDILFLVNHQEAKVTLGNELITVGKGSRIISVRQLCERWKWSNTKVKAFLDILVADKMIVYKSDTKKTVITVVNWDLYQCDNDTKTSQKRHDSITDQSQKRTNNNDKNDKNDEENICSDSEIEIFFKECWALYPNKKGQVSMTQKKKLFKLGDELKRCISRYLAFVKKERDGGFNLAYKNGSTFFNNGYKDYLDEVYAKPEPTKKYPLAGQIKYIEQESVRREEPTDTEIDF